MYVVVDKNCKTINGDGRERKKRKRAECVF
jgi:hypothetical protein